MGYQITFIPTEEKMKNYKPWRENSVSSLDATVKSVRRDIISYCLKDHSDLSIYQIESDMQFKVKCLYSSINDQEKYNAYDRWSKDEEHKLWYCGWEFSRETDFDKEAVIDSAMDELLLLADVVKTEDYFKEDTHFYDKVAKINEIIDEFICSVQDITIHEIIDDLKEFEEKGDDEV